MPEERALKTAARYLGVKRGSDMDAELRSLLLCAYDEMLKVAAPRHVIRRFAPVDWRWGEDAALSKALEALKVRKDGDDSDRGEVYALLATLGMGVDLLIRKMALTNPALSAAVNACASAHIDAYINAVLKEEAERLAKARGEYLTPRFSPGYGEVSLSLQAALLAFLDAQKMGVYLTKDFLMIPEKSVTALIGITKEPHHGCHTQCEICARTDCAFREE